MGARIFKVVLLGDARVGKTSIRKQYMGEGFDSEYMVTLGADFALQRLGSSLVQVWDLAGQDTFSNFRKKYVHGAHGVVIVCSMTDEQSLYNLPNWLKEVHQEIGKITHTLIVCNKIDLEDQIVLKDEQINDVAHKLSLQYAIEMPVIKTSALTGENINEAFQLLINRIMGV